jgi:hypothetical protein
VLLLIQKLSYELREKEKERECVWEHSEIGWLFVFVQLWWWLLSKDEKQLIFFEGSSFPIPYVSEWFL